jgi:hypothetical protein
MVDWDQMSGTLPPPPFRSPGDIAVDELLDSTRHLVERPFEQDDDWRENTAVYDARAFVPAPSDADRRSTVQTLKDARVGLDLFIGEASVALTAGHRDLTELQRVHLTKIVTFIEALSDRFDRVMRSK